MASTILIVDDEALIALDMEAALRDDGFVETIEVAGGIAPAIERIGRGGIACVVLDADLDGESARGVAECLRTQDVPFVVTTGYAADQLDWLGDAPLLAKPVDPKRLAAAVRDLTWSGGG